MLTRSCPPPPSACSVERHQRRPHLHGVAFRRQLLHQSTCTRRTDIDADLVDLRGNEWGKKTSKKSRAKGVRKVQWVVTARVAE